MPIIANFVYYGETRLKKLEAFLRNKIHVFSKKFIRLYFPYLHMAFKNILIINKSEIFIRYGQLFLVFQMSLKNKNNWILSWFSRKELIYMEL